MKVALVHDHLAQDGGAEKVLQVFADMYSDAPIYTLLYEAENANKNYHGKKIETSVIQKLPGGVKHYQWYLPFMPLAVEFFDLREYDLVLSDTSSFAKGVITLPNTLHVCYCHTPTRYLWSDTHQYINELKYNKWMKKIISLILTQIRMWDRLAADRVDVFIANSKTVQKRITKYYRRDSVVIYPPVETERFSIAELNPIKQEKPYFLIGCRLAPYKRVDITIEAFKALGDEYYLKIFGDGVDMKRLKKIVGDSKNIEFVGRISDEEKAELYKNALAFINPQEEDFGITPVEAMASGRPVIAYRKGGATETIEEGKTGLFFDDQTSEAITDIVHKFYTKTKNGEYCWDSAAIRLHAETFSVANFKRQITEFIANHYSKR
ncbi:MAG: glycosyltransferase [Candidatus Falkowbacteria bacterium]